MKTIRSWSRTDSCGRHAGDYEDILLTQEEWDEKAKTLEIIKPYHYSQYHLGCGWTDIDYEMAMKENYHTGSYIMLNDGRGGSGEIVIERTYFLEGHEKPLSSKHTETMNEYNS